MAKKPKHRPTVEVSNRLNIIDLTLFAGTMSQKWGNSNEKFIENLIYCKFLENVSLWAKFSKRCPIFIFNGNFLCWHKQLYKTVFLTEIFVTFHFLSAKKLVLLLVMPLLMQNTLL
jgi:hypothetical protein